MTPPLDPSVTRHDFTEYDAMKILGLAMFRWENKAAYRIAGGWSAELRTATPSNGTEAGFAEEAAETLLDMAPVLRAVLLTGVLELSKSRAFQEYAGALAAGDHEAIVRIETSLDESDFRGQRRTP